MRHVLSKKYIVGFAHTGLVLRLIALARHFLYSDCDEVTLKSFASNLYAVLTASGIVLSIDENSFTLAYHLSSIDYSDYCGKKSYLRQIIRDLLDIAYYNEDLACYFGQFGHLLDETYSGNPVGKTYRQLIAGKDIIAYEDGLSLHGTQHSNEFYVVRNGIVYEFYGYHGYVYYNRYAKKIYAWNEFLKQKEQSVIDLQREESLLI